MQKNISLVVISYNNQDTIEKTFQSVRGLVHEIILVDNSSTDRTLEIAKKYKARILFYKGKNRGIQCQMGVDKAKNDWILVLDSDEALSKSLNKEINQLRTTNCGLNKFYGFFIKFQPYYLGRKIYHGGENYRKLILFNKKKGKMMFKQIHYVWHIPSKKVGVLKNKADHHSYRNLVDLYKKFYTYGIEEAKLRCKKGEKPSLKKIFMYPAHMFWARFIKDKGYKDGFFRIPLDLGFACMEFITYFSMLFIGPKLKSQSLKQKNRLQKL